MKKSLNQMMKNEEAMQLLSMVRFGVISGIIKDVSIAQVHTLLLSSQPMHLQRAMGATLTQQQRRTTRADLIRRMLEQKPDADTGNAGRVSDER